MSGHRTRHGIAAIISNTAAGILAVLSIAVGFGAWRAFTDNPTVALKVMFIAAVVAVAALAVAAVLERRRQR